HAREGSSASHRGDRAWRSGGAELHRVAGKPASAASVRPPSTAPATGKAPPRETWPGSPSPPGRDTRSGSPELWLRFRPADPEVSDLNPCDSRDCFDSKLASFYAFCGIVSSPGRLCRTQSPWRGRSVASIPSWDKIPILSFVESSRTHLSSWHDLMGPVTDTGGPSMVSLRWKRSTLASGSGGRLFFLMASTRSRWDRSLETNPIKASLSRQEFSLRVGTSP